MEPTLTTGDKDFRFLRTAPRSLRAKILKMARDDIAAATGPVEGWKDDLVVFLETLQRLDHQRALSRVQSAASEYLVAVQVGAASVPTGAHPPPLPRRPDGSFDTFAAFSRAWAPRGPNLPSPELYWQVANIDMKRRALIDAMAQVQDSLFGARPDDDEDDVPPLVPGSDPVTPQQTGDGNVTTRVDPLPEPLDLTAARFPPSPPRAVLERTGARSPSPITPAAPST